MSSKHAEHRRQVNPAEADMWAARARTLGRSASSQLNFLQRLAVQPRMLPPRPTILENAATPTVLRSETQRLGLEKRRKMRQKLPLSDSGTCKVEDLQDLTGLEEWLSALNLGHLANSLFQVRVFQ